MRRDAASLIAILALGSALAGCAADVPANQNPAADAAAAEAVVADFFGAMEAWDYEGLRATVTPDFELVEDTLIMGMDDFVAMIEPFEAQGAAMTWELSDFNTEISGDVAWTRYHNRGHFRLGDQEARPRWIESAVLTRQPDGSWRIDRLQSNPLGGGGEPAQP